MDEFIPQLLICISPYHASKAIEKGQYCVGFDKGRMTGHVWDDRVQVEGNPIYKDKTHMHNNAGIPSNNFRIITSLT